MKLKYTTKRNENTINIKFDESDCEDGYCKHEEIEFDCEDMDSEEVNEAIRFLVWENATFKK